MFGVNLHHWKLCSVALGLCPGCVRVRGSTEPIREQNCIDVQHLNEIHLRCVVWHHRNFHLAAGRNSNLTNFISLFSAAFVEFKVKLSEMNSNDVRTQGNINHSAAPTPTTTTTTTTTWIMIFPPHLRPRPK